MSKNEPSDVFKLINMSGGRSACWPWVGAWGGRPGNQRRPYFMAEKRRTMAYRWVWELVNGPIPDDQMILHSCDNGGWPVGCCNPHHMRLGNNQENMDDMRERERHGLPRTVVNAIRTLLNRGETQQVIADRYGVSRETISAIATSRVYKPLERAAGANLVCDVPPDVPPNEPAHALQTAPITLHKQSDMLECPHAILHRAHYRPDGVCRCTDPTHKLMQSWGYMWNGERWVV